MLPGTGPLQKSGSFCLWRGLNTMRILIKNGHVIDPAAKVNSQQDLLV